MAGARAQAGVEPQEPEGRARAHAALQADGCAQAGEGGQGAWRRVGSCLALPCPAFSSCRPVPFLTLKHNSGAGHSGVHQARLRPHHGPVCAARQALRWVVWHSSAQPSAISASVVLHGGVCNLMLCTAVYQLLTSRVRVQPNAPSPPWLNLRPCSQRTGCALYEGSEGGPQLRALPLVPCRGHGQFIPDPAALIR